MSDARCVCTATHGKDKSTYRNVFEIPTAPRNSAKLRSLNLPQSVQRVPQQNGSAFLEATRTNAALSVPSFSGGIRLSVTRMLEASYFVIEIVSVESRSTTCRRQKTPPVRSFFLDENLINISLNIDVPLSNYHLGR